MPSYTQEWIIEYSTEDETWDVSGWNDFANEHVAGDVYDSLDELEGLTTEGLALLQANGVTSVDTLLGQALLRANNLDTWLVEVGFDVEEEEYIPFRNALLQRLQRAELLPCVDEEDDEDTEEKQPDTSDTGCSLQ